MTEIEILEQFRDLKILKNQLLELLPQGLNKLMINKPVQICSIHLITLLKKYQTGGISEQNVLDWVNTVWFSGLYEYCDEQCGSIAGVMNELEEIDEDGKQLTTEKADKYIHALRNNIEI